MSEQPESAAVVFNRQTHSITVNPPVITVKTQNLLKLTFSLSTIGPGTGDATFAPGRKAVEFCSQKPPQLQVNGKGTTAYLEEKNENSSHFDIAYRYRVVLKFEGEVIKSEDPHIINEGQPPDEEDKGKRRAKGRS